MKLRALVGIGLLIGIAASNLFAAQEFAYKPLSNEQREASGPGKFRRIVIKQPGKPAESEYESKLIVKSESQIDPSLAHVIPNTNDAAFRLFQAATYVDLRNFDLVVGSTIGKLIENDRIDDRILELRTNLLYDVAFHLPLQIRVLPFNFRSTHNVLSVLTISLSDPKAPKALSLVLAESKYPGLESAGNWFAFGSTSNLKFDALVSASLRHAIQKGMANDLVVAMVEDLKQRHCVVIAPNHRPPSYCEAHLLRMIPKP